MYGIEEPDIHDEDATYTNWRGSINFVCSDIWRPRPRNSIVDIMRVHSIVNRGCKGERYDPEHIRLTTLNL